MFRILLLVSTLVFSPMAWTVDVKTYIPPKAIPLLPTVKSEVFRAMPGFVSMSENSADKTKLFQTLLVPYTAALIEHESCISLTHSRCWAPTSELKTAREWGVGLGQITVAYRADGSVRFDKLKEMQQRYNNDLKELSWYNVKQRPDLQIRAIALMLRENMNTFFMVKDVMQRLKMADVAYNAGPGSVKKDRQLCGLRPNCDPQIWDGNVETNSTVSRKPIYGTRSAYDISRNHAHDTTVVRLPKYQRWFFTDVGD